MAHRPSESSRRFVKNSRGETVENTAYRASDRSGQRHAVPLRPTSRREPSAVFASEVLDDNLDVSGTPISEFADPEEADGQCWRVCNEITEVYGYDSIAVFFGDGSSHFATVAEDGKVVDFTMRQFFPAADFPYVESIDEWHSDMGQVAEAGDMSMTEPQVGQLDDLEEPDWAEQDGDD